MNTQNQIAEEDLVDLLLKKKSKGLEILYDTYSATLYGVIQRILHDEVLSESVLKDTFVKIGQNLSQYDPSKGRFAAWMINTARNMAFEKLSSEGMLHQVKFKSIENIKSLGDISNLGSFNPSSSGFKEIVMNMDEDHRQILYLIFFAGFSQAEVALKLNIPLGTVKSRSRMALMKLRAYIDKLPGGKWI